MVDWFVYIQGGLVCQVFDFISLSCTSIKYTQKEIAYSCSFDHIFLGIVWVLPLILMRVTDFHIIARCSLQPKRLNFKTATHILLYTTYKYFIIRTMAFEFVIPLARKDLTKRTNVQHYVVDEVYSLRSLHGKCQECKTAFRTQGPLSVLSTFDTFYSALW